MNDLSNEKRIERLENILIDLAFYKRKCAYVYLNDVQKALKKYGLIKEIPDEKIYRIVYKNKNIYRLVYENKKQGGR